MTSEKQFEKIKTQDGFIAALDQSGGSTPKALRVYGIDESEYSNDEEMFELVHAMRTRIITSPAFGGDRLIGAILFENTMEREIDGMGSAEYLWKEKQVVPFLKVDKGLADERDGVQLMKPMPGLGEMLERAKTHRVFGTKMRSVVKRADPEGIREIVDQQFEVARQIGDAGLVPIIEPEVDINAPDKGEAEVLLEQNIMKHLEGLPPDHEVMLKLTLPDVDDFYVACIEHPKVLRVVALSGGYSRDEANAKLARNHGMTASFSRALTEGLRVDQSDEEFDATLDRSIQSTFEASKT